MRLLIPTQSDDGPRSRLSDHFGRAPYFAIADTTTGHVIAHANEASDHGSDGCAPVDLIGGSWLADAVVCRGIGRRALARLVECGIPVFVAQGPDVAAVLADHRAGRVVAAGPDRRHASGADECGGRGCGSHAD